MTYLHEFRVHWRNLAAASAGMASGASLYMFITNTFAPHLLKEFGWSKSQFALSGVMILLGVITLPVAGRLTDTFGVRRMAMIGTTLTPIIYVADSRITDNFLIYLALVFIHFVIGALTSMVVYSRLIVTSFDRSRGLALSIAACAAPAVCTVGSVFLSEFIDAHGWRAGYLAMAAATAIGGILVFLLIPIQTPDTAKAGDPIKRNAAREYSEILRNPTFQKIALGTLLCCLTVIVQSSQLKVILLDSGVTSSTAATLTSLYGIGVVIGRLCCGVALDRFPAHIVAALFLGLPCIGLLILASGSIFAGLFSVAVLFIGMSTGAETDIVAYLVRRYFKVETYGTVYGLMQPTVAVSGALGSLLLSMTLHICGGFSVFLYVTAAATLVGSGVIITLRRSLPIVSRVG